MKKLLLSLLLACTTASATTEQIEYDRPVFVYSHKIGSEVGFYYNGSEYHVVADDVDYTVQNAFVDSKLRNVSPEQLVDMLDFGYIEIKKFIDSDDFALVFKQRMLGGGGLGAMLGTYAGGFIVNLVCHGAILAVSAGIAVINPPAGAATAIALEKTFAGTIAAASMVGAMTGGIAAGVATGPI